MITIGGENLIDYVQTEVKDGLPVYTAIPGGSCYNVAIAAARQGQTVSYVTPISTQSAETVEAFVVDAPTLGDADCVNAFTISIVSS